MGHSVAPGALLDDVTLTWCPVLFAVSTNALVRHVTSGQESGAFRECGVFSYKRASQLHVPLSSRVM